MFNCDKSHVNLFRNCNFFIFLPKPSYSHENLNAFSKNILNDFVNNGDLTRLKHQTFFKTVWSESNDFPTLFARSPLIDDFQEPNLIFSMSPSSVDVDGCLERGSLQTHQRPSTTLLTCPHKNIGSGNKI